MKRVQRRVPVYQVKEVNFASLTLAEMTHPNFFLFLGLLLFGTLCCVIGNGFLIGGNYISKLEKINSLDASFFRSSILALGFIAWLTFKDNDFIWENLGFVDKVKHVFFASCSDKLELYGFSAPHPSMCLLDCYDFLDVQLVCHAHTPW